MKPKKKSGKKKKAKAKRKKVDKGVPLTEMESFILTSGGKLAMKDPARRAEGARELKDKAFELAEHDAFMKQELKVAAEVFSSLSREKKAIWLFLTAFDPAIRQALWKVKKMGKGASRKYFLSLKSQIESRSLDESILELVARYSTEKK